MIITKIEKQKKNESRFSIFIDGEFAFGMSGTDVLFYNLKENMELDESTYSYIINEVEFIKARETALKFLSYRMRTEKEIRDKLREKEFGEIVTEKVLDVLRKYEYINDYDFAKAFIKEKMNLKGFGKVRIVHELYSKGVGRENITSAYNDLFSDSDALKSKELENAYLALSKKYANKNLDFKEIKKAIDFLLRKGFSYELSKKCIDRLIKEKNCEVDTEMFFD